MQNVAQQLSHNANQDNKQTDTKTGIITKREKQLESTDINPFAQD